MKKCPGPFSAKALELLDIKIKGLMLFYCRNVEKFRVMEKERCRDAMRDYLDVASNGQGNACTHIKYVYTCKLTYKSPLSLLSLHHNNKFKFCHLQLVVTLTSIVTLV